LVLGVDELTVRAPTRIDLAGGTLDIYPLYLFAGGGATLNIAIDIFSTVKVRTGGAKGLLLRSLDLGEEMAVAEPTEAPEDGSLALLGRAVRHFSLPLSRLNTGLEIITSNEAPKGSGLGASSSLLIALIFALKHYLDSTALNEGRGARGLEEVLSISADLEAQLIGIPVGTQDYYAALYGGVSRIDYGVATRIHRHISLSPSFSRTLQDSLILTFTGAPHYSAVTNWGMVKAYIEDSGSTRRRMQDIKETALAMGAALESEDLGQFARLISREWQNRKGLADGVTTPFTEELIARAEKAGALASKICGAGGGGCLLTVAPPEPEVRQLILSSLVEAGAQHLPFTFSPLGVSVLSN